jgi:type IV secretory pathway VirB2 component (pilin)
MRNLLLALCLAVLTMTMVPTMLNGTNQGAPAQTVLTATAPDPMADGIDGIDWDEWLTNIIVLIFGPQPV